MLPWYFQLCFPIRNLSRWSCTSSNLIDFKSAVTRKMILRVLLQWLEHIFQIKKNIYILFKTCFTNEIKNVDDITPAHSWHLIPNFSRTHGIPVIWIYSSNIYYATSGLFQNFNPPVKGSRCENWEEIMQNSITKNTPNSRKRKKKKSRNDF